jgi:cupin 2 domain-containing protein
MRIGNLFLEVGETGDQEQVDGLVETGALRLERIVSAGHATPPGQWFDQDRDEWVVLLTGSASLRFEDESKARDMRPGDFVLIPAHRRHRVERTDPNVKTIWLALHFDARPTPSLR